MAKWPYKSHYTGFLSKKVLGIIFLLTNSLVWYLYSLKIIEKSVGSSSFSDPAVTALWASHFTVLIATALLGVFLTKKIGGRWKSLVVWMAFGTIVPFIILMVNPTSYLQTFLMSLLFAGSFGLGMPNLMGYFTNQTPVQNHGRIGGLMILGTGVGSIIFGLALSLGSFELQAVILSLWRAAGLGLLLVMPYNEGIQGNSKSQSYKKIIVQRSFILYLVPWIMFSLLNYLTTPVQNNTLDLQAISNLSIIGNGCLAITALVSGFLMDIIGRKRITILGFVMLGLSYSMIGFYQSAELWYIHSVINGISWGILYVLFIVTIWGDLSIGQQSDKFYAIGVTPFFVSKFLELTINSELVRAIPITQIFSFTAFFLFLAVLPLFYAPETLPEKVIKDNDLKSYIERAQKKVEKNIAKPQRRQKEQNTITQTPPPALDENYEKAKELAEKYY